MNRQNRTIFIKILLSIEGAYKFMSSAAQPKARLVEKGPGWRSGWSDFPKHLNQKTIAAGIISTIFGCTGPALVVIDSATKAGYNQAQIVSWLFGIYFFGGLLGVLLASYYKMPISGAYSIPGAAMMATALVGVPFEEAVGAFFMAGVIVLVLGLSGLIGKIMRWLPLPIVMAMITGAMIRFGTGVVTAIISFDSKTGALNLKPFIVGGSALLAFFLMPKLTKKIAPVVAALVVGLVAALATGTANFATNSISFIPPSIFVPQIRIGTFLSVAIPLAALVMGAENAQAVGVLYAQGYKPPINAMTVFSGVGGMVASLFGALNANIAGPMTAICSSSEAGENKDGRYVASIVNGITFGTFGIVASIALSFVKALPSGLISVLAGLAMINVLTGALNGAFGSMKFKVGAFFGLVVAMSGITILKIGAPFWALLIGTIISLVAEPQDFKQEDKAKAETKAS